MQLGRLACGQAAALGDPGLKPGALSARFDPHGDAALRIGKVVLGDDVKPQPANGAPLLPIRLA